MQELLVQSGRPVLRGPDQGRQAHAVRPGAPGPRALAAALGLHEDQIQLTSSTSRTRHRRARRQHRRRRGGPRMRSFAQAVDRPDVHCPGARRVGGPWPGWCRDHASARRVRLAHPERPGAPHPHDRPRRPIRAARSSGHATAGQGQLGIAALGGTVAPRRDRLRGQPGGRLAPRAGAGDVLRLSAPTPGSIPRPSQSGSGAGSTARSASCRSAVSSPRSSSTCGEQVSGIFLFEQDLPVNDSFVVLYAGQPSDDWQGKQRTLERERARVALRERRPAPAIPWRPTAPADRQAPRRPSRAQTHPSSVVPAPALGVTRAAVQSASPLALVSTARPTHHWVTYPQHPSDSRRPARQLDGLSPAQVGNPAPGLRRGSSTPGWNSSRAAWQPRTPTGTGSPGTRCSRSGTPASRTTTLSSPIRRRRWPRAPRS